MPPQLMHHLNSSQSEFTLHNDPHSISSVVKYVQRLLRCLPLGSRTERLRVGLALDAALSNALFHGNMEITKGTGEAAEDRMQLLRERIGAEPYCHRRIHLSVSIDRERAEFVVRDDGEGFDVSGFSAEDAIIGADPNCGRGLAMMFFNHGQCFIQRQRK